MLTMYAIANCDTVKKARKYLEENAVEYTFIDFKKVPPTKDQIKRWQDFLNELPVNKKGTTYRKIKDEYEALTESKKLEFIIINSSMIKRPILEKNNKTLAIGFDVETYDTLKIR